MARIVLDASVVGKWFLDDKVDGDRALRLRRGLVDGDLAGIAPGHLPLELAGALLRAVRRGRFPADSVGPALSAMEAFILETEDPRGLARSAADVALSLGLHPFDAAYLVVARTHGIPLVTADEPLCDAGLRAGFDVLLLRDLPL